MTHRAAAQTTMAAASNDAPSSIEPTEPPVGSRLISRKEPHDHMGSSRWPVRNDCRRLRAKEADLIIGSVREEKGLRRPTCYRAQLPRWTVGESARETQHAIAAALMV